MFQLKRIEENPILQPKFDIPWEAQATFNGSPVRYKDKHLLLYRALTYGQDHHGHQLELSTIGLAEGKTNTRYQKRTQLIAPSEVWDRYGCEDPRVTLFEGNYYIFYTALAQYPFVPAGIQIAVAITKNFKSIEKNLVTPFNSKAGALFPKRINGKVAMLLTVNSDIPPSHIAYAEANDVEDFWSYEFWDHWYNNLQSNTLPLLRSLSDHIEVGTPPIETEKGWVCFYAYIKNYQTSNKEFYIEVVLLDKNDPRKIKARLPYSVFKTETNYEKYGVIPNIVFPSGLTVENDVLSLYYGAADTVCAIATGSLKELLRELDANKI